MQRAVGLPEDATLDPRVVQQFGVHSRPAALGSRASLVGAAEVACATVLDGV